MDRNRGFDINALRQQLDDLIEDFFPGGRRPHGGRGDHNQHLPLNVLETDDSLVVTAPLPGLQPEEIEITVRGQNLSIKAQQKNPPGDRPNFSRREWSLGPYQRSLDLPAPVDAERASAAFRHGVVTLTLPKADAERDKSVPVEGEEEPVVAEAAAEAPQAPETPATDAAGQPFYMPRQPGSRRGRDRSRQHSQPRDRRTGEAPEAATEPGSAVTPDMEAAVAQQVLTEFQAPGETAETETTAPLEFSAPAEADEPATDAPTETADATTEAEDDTPVNDTPQGETAPSGGADEEAPSVDEAAQAEEAPAPQTDVTADPEDAVANTTTAAGAPDVSQPAPHESFATNDAGTSEDAVPDEAEVTEGPEPSDNQNTHTPSD